MGGGNDFVMTVVHKRVTKCKDIEIFLKLKLTSDYMYPFLID